MSFINEYYNHRINSAESSELSEDYKRRKNLRNTLCKSVYERLREDKDFVICIDGNPGVGKSVLAYIIGYLMTEGKIDYEKSFIFSPNKQNILQTIQEIPRYGFINLDEGIKALYKLNWMSKSQKTLNINYNVNRFHNKITCICIPSFSDLNLQFRNIRVMVRIHVYARGKAAVFMKPRRLNPIDPWFVAQNEKMRDKRFRQDIMDDDVYEKYLQSCRGFAFFINFPNVTDEIRNWMNSEKEKYEALDSEEHEEEVNKWEFRTKALVYALNKFGGWKQNQIAVPIGSSQTTVSDWIISLTDTDKADIDDKMYNLIKNGGFNTDILQN